MKLQNILMTIAVFVCAIAVTSVSYADEAVEDFSFKDINGVTHQFSEYKGKWVLVNYWGTYCPPCLEEIPDLVSFADKHKKDLVILGMDAGGTDVKSLQEFAAENMMQYVIAPVQESTLTAFGILMGIPTTYIITPEGQVAGKVIGIIDLDAVEQLMREHAGGGSVTKADQAADEILDL